MLNLPTIPGLNPHENTNSYMISLLVLTLSFMIYGFDIIKNGYKKDLAQEVYDLILEFANYGFNKSHSVAYGMVAYQLAYLKANYPLYFYKALLNGVIGAQAKTYDYISECQNIGQKVKGVSINESDYLYKIEDKQIRMPLSIIKDVGNASCEKIIEDRQTNGKYKDYVSCVTRLVNSGVDKNVIENLIYGIST